MQIRRTTLLMPEFLTASFSIEKILPVRLALLALICLGAFLSTASAQTSLGTVSGTVTDSSKAVIPEATVVLTDVKKGVNRTVTTNQQGLYLFNAVELGTYSIKFSASGF